MEQSLTFQPNRRLKLIVTVMNEDLRQRTTEYSCTVAINDSPLTSVTAIEPWGRPAGRHVNGMPPTLHSLVRRFSQDIADYLKAWQDALHAGFDHEDERFGREVHDTLVASLGYQYHDFLGFAARV